MSIPIYFTLSALSAFLLFMVQPLVAKAALPTLGGAPFVWNGCMVFFQTLLLCGYGYAYLMQRFVSLKKQLYVHIALIALAIFSVPKNILLPDSPNPALHPQLWLTVMLAINTCLPFFIMSATAPLAQYWFSANANTRAGNPYFLYAASNLGSFAALLTYPFIIEPQLDLLSQLALFRLGLAALFLLFVLAAIALNRHATNSMPTSTDTDALSPSGILQWVMLAFVPASLLYGVTSYITTDMASLPLFWVIPLALYLLSFVLAFSPNASGVALCRKVHLPLAGALVIFILLSNHFAWWVMLLHLAVFFITAVACHGRLAALKPPISGLTRFYLWIALGGALAGIFNTFIAPRVFPDVFEYPLMLLLSMALSLPLTRILIIKEYKAIRDTVLAAFIIGLVVPLIAQFFYSPLKDLFNYAPYELRPVVDWLAVYAIFIVFFLFLRQHGAQGIILTTSVLILYPIVTNYVYLQKELFVARNIFGVSRVLENFDLNARIYQNGTTQHGIQSQDKIWRLRPIPYYFPLSHVFSSLDSSLTSKPVAVLGLGIGTISCYGKEGQLFDFFEINPLVERIARDWHLFTYLHDSPAQCQIYIGDARIGISHMPDNKYGLIIADAFSSDAIPAHLLTKEAAAIYFAKLDAKGAIAFDITNRHLNLKPVVQALASTQGARCYFLDYDPHNATLQYGSWWVVLSRDEKFGKRLLSCGLGWQDITSEKSNSLWTDNFMNLARSIKWFE